MEPRRASKDREKTPENINNSISGGKTKSSLNEEKRVNISESKCNVNVSTANEIKRVKDINTIRGFPIHCVLCQITSFKHFTDVVAHVYGQRHRRVGYKMVHLESNKSITFKGTILLLNS